MVDVHGLFVLSSPCNRDEATTYVTWKHHYIKSSCRQRLKSISKDHYFESTIKTTGSNPSYIQANISKEGKILFVFPIVTQKAHIISV